MSLTTVKIVTSFPQASIAAWFCLFADLVVQVGQCSDSEQCSDFYKSQLTVFSFLSAAINFMNLTHSSHGDFN